MSIRVQSDLSLAQEDAFSLAENRAVAPAAWFLLHYKMTEEKGMDETSLHVDVRVWPIWESINQGHKPGCNSD